VPKKHLQPSLMFRGEALITKYVLGFKLPGSNTLAYLSSELLTKKTLIILKSSINNLTIFSSSLPTVGRSKVACLFLVAHFTPYYGQTL
jgi:hypothetical protein